MPWSKHWELRTHIKDFYAKEEGYKYGSECRYVILDYLLLRTNPRLRTFVGVETIMQDTGITSDAAVAGAIKWLFDHGAIYNVPYRYRVGKEAELPNRKYVFQLTGVINLGGEWIKYLLFSEEDLGMMLDEWQSVGLELPVEPTFLCPTYQSSLNEGSQSSPNEGSLDEGKVLQGISRSSKTTAGAPSPSAQSSSGGHPLRQDQKDKIAGVPKSASDLAGKEKEVIPDVPSTASSELLISAAMEAYGLEGYIPNKRLWNKLNKGASIGKVPYGSPINMYKSDTAFKVFADERLKLMHNIGKDIDTALNNVSNYDSYPDEFNKRRMKGYHHWLRDHVQSVSLAAAPKPVQAAVVDI